MEKNSGKIAIAIVAMFVVALSVVGFTYAYFVAQIQGNTADKSVNVTAGILEVAYANGNEISVTNIVPGWVSDGNHYFDSASYNSVGGEIRYNACVKNSNVDDNEVYNATSNPTGTRNIACDDSKALPKNGAVTPVTFTVTNNSRATNDTAYYAIILNGVTNTLPDGLDESGQPSATETNEQARFTYTLTCKGCGAEGADTVVGTANTQFPNSVAVISDLQSIADFGADKDYELMLSYANDATGAQTNVTGSQVKATVEIVGVAQGADGAWYDANGVKILNS